MSRIGLVLLLVAALSLSGCAQVTEKAVEQATGVKTSQNGDSVTIKGNDGQSVTVSGSDTQVPEELKSFPVPQGFKYDGGGSMSSGGKTMVVASWKGSGDLKAVTDFYTKTMPSQGWTEQSKMTTDDGALLNYSKGEADGVTVTTSKEDDGITISVLAGKN